MPIEIFLRKPELSRMTNVAYVFPGQGSQLVGMTRDLYKAIPASKSVIDTAAEILGGDLIQLMFDGPKDKLDQTENTQPLILTASVACLVGYLSENPQLRKQLPTFSFGHSAGELTALVASGVLTFEEAIQTARTRGKLMAEAPPGKMTVVKNISQEELTYILKIFQVDIGVINSAEQIVLSGEAKAIDAAYAYMKSKGIKTTVLPISIASHSRVMEPVRKQFASALNEFLFRNPRVPIISVYGAQLLEDGSKIREAFVNQMTKTLNFPQMISAAQLFGINTFVEFGPKGQSTDGIITGNIRALNPSFTTFNVRDLATVKSNVGLSVKMCV